MPRWMDDDGLGRELGLPQRSARLSRPEDLEDPPERYSLFDPPEPAWEAEDEPEELTDAIEWPEILDIED